MNKRAYEFVSSLFEFGFHYRVVKDNKPVYINPKGGALRYPGYVPSKSASIEIVDEQLNDFIQRNNTVLTTFTTTKIRHDRDGNAMTMPNGQFVRVLNGLMLYCEGDTKPLVNAFRESVPRLAHLSITASELKQHYDYDLPKDMKEFKVKNKLENFEPLDRMRTIWLACLSGRIGGDTTIWYNRRSDRD